MQATTRARLLAALSVAALATTARSAAPGQAFATLNAASGIVPSPENLRNAAGARSSRT